MSSSRRRACRVWAPRRRFSITVMSCTMPRPSMTWKMPRCTMRSGARRVISSPSKVTRPRVMAPSSLASRPEIAFSVVDLPAPLAPSSAVMPPRRAERLSPRSTRMTSLNTTSTFSTSRMGPAPDAAAASMSGGLLPEPAVLALEHRLAELLDLGLAVHEVAAVDGDDHGAAVVGRRPGRGQADAFEALRHPVGLGIHAVLDLLAGDAAVGLGPLHRLL